MLACLCTNRHPYWMNLTVLIATHELTHQFHIPNFEPVTYVCRYVDMYIDMYVHTYHIIYMHAYKDVYILVMWCHWHLYYIMPTASLIAFLRSRQSKRGATWHFWSFDTIGTGLGTTWCWQHHQWHHCIPKSRWSNWGTSWLYGHVVLLALALASCTWQQHQ